MMLTLPLPPSLNGYFLGVVRKRKNGTLYSDTVISGDGRAYVKAVREVVAKQIGVNRVALSGRLSLTIVIQFRTRAAADLDNRTKALFDALTKAGLWLDDSQIDSYRVTRGEIVKGGSVTVTIREFAAPAAEKTLFSGEE